MSIYDFIDKMIVRLDGMTVKGAANCAAIVQTINDLGQLKQVITVREPEKEAADADDQNEPG